MIWIYAFAIAVGFWFYARVLFDPRVPPVARIAIFFATLWVGYHLIKHFGGTA